ncbi:MAG: tetratricopeptide repeat protein [Tepidisphaeraceae bacterium]
MTIRPKTKRRVLILITVLAIFSGAVAWLYSYRMGIAEGKLELDKQLGMAAYRKGDYPTAVDKLSEYINHEQKRPHNQLDPEALLAFANARAKVPTKNEDYIVLAIKTLQWYCTLVPENAQAKDQLLEMEAAHANFAPDVLARANDILRSNPNDLVALKAIAQVNVAQKKYADAAPAARRYVELAPTDLDMQRINFEIMQATGVPAADMQKYADALRAKYPTDPRFKIVKAWAYSFGRSRPQTADETLADRKEYLALVLSAAKDAPPSSQFVRTTIGLLDALGEFGVAEDLLNRAAAKFNDPQLTQQLIVRLWEYRKFSDVVTRLKTLDAASPTANATLIAYKALALFQMGQDKDANALVDQLAARGADDRAAYAWATTLKAQYGAPPEDLKTRMAQYRDAQAAAPDNGYVAFLLGDAYAKLGESELALQAFRRSCQEMPSWSEPHAQLSLLLVQEGRGGSPEAIQAAEEARLAGTNAAGSVNLQAAIADIKVSYASLLASPDANNTTALMDEVKQLQAQLPNEPQTLPIYVALLWQTGQRDAAIDAIKGACKNPGDGGEELLMDLVQASRAAKLGMEQSIYAAIQAKYGLTPRLAYARAMELLNAGQAADGLKLLLDAKQKSKSTDDAGYWDRAICQYREVSHDPGAAAAWEKLGNTYPNDIGIQSAILTGGNSAWADRDFIRQTIDRVKSLTGEEALGWKTAYARWLLSGSGAEKDATEAVVLLTGVTTQNPDAYMPHVLLATAYDRLKNFTGGLGEWRKAAELAPQSPQAQFALLQALHNADKRDEAQVVFDKLQAIGNLPPDLALAAATILAAEGDMPRAEKMLLKYPKSSNQSGGEAFHVLHDATLAKVYRLENRPNDAARIYFDLANAKTLDVNTIREAADFFAAQGELAEARKFLDRLVETPLPAGQRQLLQAAFEEEHGTVEAAGKLYDDAVKSAGDDPGASIRQIGFLMRRHDWTKAQSALDKAAGRWPANQSVANLAKAVAELANYTRLDEMGTLIEAVTADPQSAAANDSIAIATDPASTPSQVRSLLEKYPDFEPLYELASRRMMSAGDPTQALSIARKAMGRFPRLEDAARTMAEVNAATGNWAGAVVAAREWRRRIMGNPRSADQFIAMADLEIQQPQDAVDRLSPYVAEARAHADDNQALLTIYSEALIRAGRQSDAAALLQPLAQNESRWRMAWLDLAPVSFMDGAASGSWIAQVKPLLNPDSIEEQEDLAEVYVACADKQGYPQDYGLARDALRPFVQTPKMGSRQWLTYAGASAGAGDAATARQAYRQVLRLDPTNAIAQNNLADLLRQSNDADSLKEAEGLVNQAIASHGNDPDAFNYFDTLARILMKEGRADDAIAAFEKGHAIDPKNLDILIGLASACASSNRPNAAIRYLSQIDGLLPPGTQLSGELAAELATARQAVHKSDSRNSVSGTDYSPAGK